MLQHTRSGEGGAHPTTKSVVAGDAETNVTSMMGSELILQYTQIIHKNYRKDRQFTRRDTSLGRPDTNSRAMSPAGSICTLDPEH
jgi:hypothetical protein